MCKILQILYYRIDNTYVTFCICIENLIGSIHLTYIDNFNSTMSNYMTILLVPYQGLKLFEWSTYIALCIFQKYKRYTLYFLLVFSNWFSLRTSISWEISTLKNLLALQFMSTWSFNYFSHHNWTTMAYLVMPTNTFCSRQYVFQLYS